MTEMRDAIVFVGFWGPPMPPPPDATILNYLNDREGGGGAIIFCRTWRPPPSKDATMLNILMTGRRGAPIKSVTLCECPESNHHFN